MYCVIDAKKYQSLSAFFIFVSNVRAIYKIKNLGKMYDKRKLSSLDSF